MNVLITGATGYVGGRLFPALAKAGHSVRCLARRPTELRQSAGSNVEVVAGDLLDYESTLAALGDVDTAYYLVHSMGTDSDFAEADRIAAQNFARAAAAAGVRHIIYLGGLGEDGDGLSSHLRSRHEVGEILRSGEVPVTEFRASIVIGSGSLSFEMVRALVERLPIMITPKWVTVPAQPIAIGDVLAYLQAALARPSLDSQVYEIGGSEQTSYGGIMREYAKQRGLTRWMLPVPVLTPYISSLWLGLVTPLFARVGRKLVASICNPTIVRDDRARQHFDIHPMGLEDAIATALRNEDSDFASTRWSDSVSVQAMRKPNYAGVRFGNRLIDVRERRTTLTQEQVFRAVESIGGDTGWYYGNFLWRLRGALDLLCGGVGMRRGRRHPQRLEPGDVLDCWRVTVCDRPHRLLLRAEMKLPGRAWLEFRVREDEYGCWVRQTATFDPIGPAGLGYWYAVAPLHGMVFRGMLRGLVNAAEREAVASGLTMNRGNGERDEV